MAEYDETTPDPVVTIPSSSSRARTRAGVAGRNRNNPDIRSVRALQTAQRQAVKADAERKLAYEAAEANNANLLTIIETLQGQLASISDKEVRDALGKSVDDLSRQSREASANVQTMRQASVDAGGDTNMNDLDDLDNDDSEAQGPIDLETAKKSQVETVKDRAIEVQLAKALSHLPRPKQGFYVDKFQNLQPIDALSTENIHPLAKQQHIDEETGAIKVTKYIVRIGDAPNCVYRFLRQNEIDFPDDVVAGLPIFPTPKKLVKKTDVKHITGVAYHGSAEILCDEGLGPRQTKSGLRHNEIYLVLPNADGTYKFPTGTTFVQVHGKGIAPGFKGQVKLEDEPYHGARRKIQNSAEESQYRWERETLRVQLEEKFEKGELESSEESLEGVKAGQDAMQNSSEKQGPKSVGQNAVGVGDSTGSTSANHTSQASSNQATLSDITAATKPTAPGDESAGSAPTSIERVPAVVIRSPAVVTKPAGETSAQIQDDEDVVLPSIEIDDDDDDDDEGLKPASGKVTARQLITPPVSESPQPQQ